MNDKIKKIYSFDDLVEGFKQIPLTDNRVIMVHSSYKSLGSVDGGAQTVIDALLEVVGPEGTILFPNFNFQSWTENHYFDVIETPSRMGIIGELARLHPGAVRTPHPIYSFAALGAKKEEFKVCNDEEAYGPNSAFARFHKLNGVIVSIGLHWNSTFSMHHYIEYNVGCNYRRIKEFSGIYMGYDRNPSVRKYTMFVRKDANIITDIVEGMDALYEKGVINGVTVGDATVHYATAENFYDQMSMIIRNNPEMLHKVKGQNY